ncbi:hypothetical protein Hanom_Chr09g00868031 [Helianthus anomalus]
MIYEKCEFSPRECLCIARERMGRAQTNLCKQDQHFLLLRYNLKTLPKFVIHVFLSFHQMNLMNI